MRSVINTVMKMLTRKSMSQPFRSWSMSTYYYWEGLLMLKVFIGKKFTGQ